MTCFTPVDTNDCFSNVYIREVVRSEIQKVAECFEGDSAYTVAVNNGYVGTEDEWLASLGGTISDIKAVSLEAGSAPSAKLGGTPRNRVINLGIPKGEKGNTGIQGIPGPTGLSAYDIAVANGFNGTKTDWLLAIKGAKGDIGPEGPEGKEGKSTYELSVDYGYSGSEREWLTGIINDTELMNNLNADLLSIDEAANGDENTTVVTRTGETYPSAKKAISEGIISLFENGGLPATPFNIYSDLQTSGLEEGSLALVLKDPEPSLNGYYVKQQGGDWELANFNPASSSEVSEIASSLKNIDFEKSRNLIDTEYYNHVMERVVTSDGTRPQILTSVNTMARLIIQRVEPNTTYTVKYSSPHLGDHFRLALFENSPNITQPSDLIGSLGREEIFQKGVKECTFTTRENEGYLALYVSSQGQDPKPQLELGSVATDYVAPATYIRNVKLESLTKDNFPHIVNQNKNLFHGHYRDELIFLEGNEASFLHNNFASFFGKNAAIKVEGGKQYTISFHPEDLSLVSPLTIACSEKYYPDNRKRTTESESKNLYPVHHLMRLGFVTKPITVSVPVGHNYLYVYVSNQGNTPRMQVEEGDKATDFIENKQIIPEVLESTSLLKKASGNIFNGKLEKIGLIESLDIENSTTGGTVTDPTKTYAVKSGSATIHGLSAIVQVDPNTTYAVSRTTENGSGFVKIAAFKQNPVILDSVIQDTTNVESYPFGRTVNIVAEADNVLVRTEDEETYLVIHVGLTYVYDMTQVTQGTEFKEIKAQKIIPNYLLEASEAKVTGGVPEHSSDAAVTHANNFVELPSNYSEDWWGLESLPYRLKKLVKYNYNVNLYQEYYRQGALKDFFPDKNPDNEVKVVDVHAKYHALVDKYPEYFSKTFIGKAESDYDMYRYETNPVTPFISKSLPEWIPDMLGNIPLRQPTFFITSGIHGSERAATYSVYYFFEELLENPQEDPLLDWIKNNVKFVIVPAVSPSGFDLNRYGNVNMNLNRDFPPYGSATQAETRIAMQQITEWADKIDFHYDFHNSAGHSGSKVGYALTDSRELAMGALSVYQDIGKKLSKEFPDIMTQDPRYIYGWTAPANIGTIGKYSQEIHGIRSMIFETYRWGDKAMFAGMPLNNELVTRWGVDLMFHMVLMGLREIIK